MILTARLYITGHKTGQDGIPLNSCDFSFSQEVDARGLPVSAVRGGIIHVSYASFDDPDIVAWMFRDEADKDGYIEFAGVESSKAFKKLEFKNARCISYRESFSRDHEMLVEISISSREIELSGMNHVNTWSGYEHN